MIEGITIVGKEEEKVQKGKDLYFGEIHKSGNREGGRLSNFHNGKYLPTRWTNKHDEITHRMWQEVTQNFWLDRDINFTRDIETWNKDMSEAEKVTFIKCLSGLSVLDSYQGTNGMGLIAYHETDGQIQAVLEFNAMMEHIHAKFYSKSFQAYIPVEIIDEYMEEWVKGQENLQRKTDFIISHYNKLLDPDPSKEDLWKAKASSVMLESALFYSGFYYPLALNGGIGSKEGNARMVDTADGISLILRDENLHGQFMGWIAENNFHEWFDEKQKEELKEWLYRSLRELYEEEVEYTHELYDPIGLTEDVLTYVRFNFNRVCMQLGFDGIFPEEPINPIIENGISIETATADMFSRKSEYTMGNFVPSNEDDWALDDPFIINNQ